MKSIGITAFSLEFSTQDDKKIILDDLFNEGFVKFFSSFLNSLKDDYDNDIKKQKVLTVEQYNQDYGVDESTGEVIYTQLRGAFKSGEYGLESEIIDTASGEVVFEKKENYADVLPFNFALGIPKGANDKAVILLQSISNYGIKTVFESSFKKYIAEVLNKPIRISLGTLIPQEYLDRILKSASFNKVRLIKYTMPDDVCDKFGINKGVLNKDCGYLETVFNRGRSKNDGLIKALSTHILSSYQKNTSLYQLVELNNYEYDNIKIEVAFGNRIKTLSMNNLNSLNITEDITDEVHINEGGLPNNNSVQEILIERLEEYLELTGLLGWFDVCRLLYTSLNNYYYVINAL